MSEKERKVRNEFKIIDNDNNYKWVTIDWHESKSNTGNKKGTGYLNDISEKKKSQKDKQNFERRKVLKEFFSVSLLRYSEIGNLTLFI